MCSSESNGIAGKVNWINYERGFGFLTLAHIEGDVFFRYKDVKNGDIQEMHDGDKIEATIMLSDKGLRATAVYKVA